MQGRGQMFQLIVGNLWLHGLNCYNSGRKYRQSEHYIFQLASEKTWEIHLQGSAAFELFCRI